MFRIAICDDEATSLQLNKRLTEKIMQEEGISCEIDTFESMTEMIEALTRTSSVKRYDILLSDILTTEMNGIEAAGKLRKLGEQLDIIFISTTAEFALEGYRVQALRYMQKPVDIEQLREALLISYRKHSNRMGLQIPFENRMITVNYKDICYVESSGRDIILCLTDRKITVHIKISDMEKMLPEKDFFRCHRSYIVNLSQIERIERYQLTMKNNDVLSISQQLYSETKAKYYRYDM